MASNLPNIPALKKIPKIPNIFKSPQVWTYETWVSAKEESVHHTVRDEWFTIKTGKFTPETEKNIILGGVWEFDGKAAQISATAGGIIRVKLTGTNGTESTLGSVGYNTDNTYHHYKVFTSFNGNAMADTTYNLIIEAYHDQYTYPPIFIKNSILTIFHLDNPKH